jgi:hypothetical protein
VIRIALIGGAGYSHPAGGRSSAGLELSIVPKICQGYQNESKEIEIRRNPEGPEKGRFSFIRRNLHTGEVRGSNPLSPAISFSISWTSHGGPASFMATKIAAIPPFYWPLTFFYLSIPAQSQANLSGVKKAAFSDQLLEIAGVNIDTALKDLQSRLSGLSGSHLNPSLTSFES